MAQIQRPATFSADWFYFTAIRIWLWIRFPNLFLWYLSKSLKHKRLPDPALPQTANDKFHWRKAFDRDPRLTLLSDKLACKEWVRDRFPDVKIARVLWVGERAEDLPQHLIGPDVVIKTNHSSATNIFPGRENLSYREVVRRARKHLRNRKPYRLSQTGYYDIPRRLFIEKLIDAPPEEFNEVKLYAYGPHLLRGVRYCGPPTAFTGQRFMADIGAPLTRDPLPPLAARLRGSEGTLVERPLPPRWDRVLEIASDIGAQFDQIRIDLYCIGDEIWWGEATVYNTAGQLHLTGNDPESPENRAWDLRRTWFLTQPPQSGWKARYARKMRAVLDRQSTTTTR